MEDFLTQKDFEIQKELGCRISMYLGKILWQRKNVFYMIFYSVGWFDTIGKFSILREYVLKMDLMHSGNLIILYTMYRCIPSYGAHCPSRNTPQRDLRKRGDWIWGDLVAHSLFLTEDKKIINYLPTYAVCNMLYCEDLLENRSQITKLANVDCKNTFCK